MIPKGKCLRQPIHLNDPTSTPNVKDQQQACTYFQKPSPLCSLIIIDSTSHMDPYSKQSLANAIFMTRASNDQLLTEATEIATSNRALQSALASKLARFPLAFHNWWQNNREMENIADFTQELAYHLQFEIDKLSEQIATFRAGREMRTAEQEKEEEDEAELRARVQQLEGQLGEARQKNDASEKELAEIEGIRKVVVSQIMDMEQKRNFLNAEAMLQKDQQSRIHSSSHKDSPSEAEYLHYVGMQTLITHYLDRKQEMTKKETATKEEISNLKSRISALRQEKEGAHLRKQAIINSHKQIEQLKEELRYRQESRLHAAKRKHGKEEEYCEQYMEEVIMSYRPVEEKYSDLMARTLTLVKSSMSTVDLGMVGRLLE